MKAIIDTDPVVYAVGFANDLEPLKFQYSKVDEFIEDIKEQTEATEAVLYLTGKGNYRFDVATIQPYKGHRDHSHRPQYYKELREYLIEKHGAILIEGMEADDACGVDAHKCLDSGIDYVVCTIDKDLKMIGGNFYDYKRRELSEISEEEALRFFYTQCLTGDSSDNIPGLFKLTGARATKKRKEPLLELSSRSEMAEYIAKTYLEEGATLDSLCEVATLLWIRRSEDGSELEEILGEFRSVDA